MSLLEIVAQDAVKAAEQAAHVTQVDERRRRASKGCPNRRNASDVLGAMWDAKALIPHAQLRTDIADGLTDQHNADKYGLKRTQIAYPGVSLGLRCNPAKRKSILDLPALAHLSDVESAERLS